MNESLTYAESLTYEGPTAAADATPATDFAEVSALRFSVVVCCYTERRFDDIIAALASLRGQTLMPSEVLVVVDYCQPLLERLRDEAPWATVVPNVHTKGLSGARSTGVEAANGEVVALLDDDAVAAPDWLERFAREYGDPDVMAVGGYTDPAWVTRRPGWFPREFDWVIGCSYAGLPEECVAVRNVFGGNMSFRRDVLCELGGFNSAVGRLGDTPLGGEETELCIRAHARFPGKKILYQPAAVIRHKVPAERCAFAYFARRCFHEGASKAVVARLAGRGGALTTERSYVRRVLPRGVLRGVADTLTGRGLDGFARVFAIIVGLAITVGGYAYGHARRVVDRGMERGPRPGGIERGPRPGSMARRAAALALPLVPAAVAVGLWWASLGHVDLRAMNDAGLVSVLPAPYWAALGILVGVFPILVHRGRVPGKALALHLVALLVVIHATPAILYGTLRYSWAWKHVGIVDYIVRHGSVDPSIPYLSAYHAWPGFFALNAFLTQASGLHSALAYASFGPVFFEVILLGPLLMLFRAMTSDRRLVWLAVMIFYLGNWVGQDYFSPQAFAFFLYLTVLAIALRWLRRLPHRGYARTRLVRWLAGGTPLLREEPTPGQRAALVGIVLVCTVTIASSHQLTPFMLVTALAVLVFTRYVGPRWLPFAAAAMTIAWICFMGLSFLSENLYWIVQSIGHPTDNTEKNFVTPASATAAQMLVNYADRILSAGLWLLAVAGFLIRRRRGCRDVVPVLLAISPIPMIFANSYGGEMLFRVFLFALPFIALLAARAVYSSAAALADGRRAWIPVALCLALVEPFILSYYGKERMNYFTPQEVAASRWFYDTAPTGSLLIGPTSNMPWAFTHYETYGYAWLADLPKNRRKDVADHPVRQVLWDMREESSGGPTYVAVMRSQGVATRYTGVFPPGAVRTMDEALVRDPRFRVVYANRDATIFRYAPAERVEPPPRVAAARRKVGLPPSPAAPGASRPSPPGESGVPRGGPGPFPNSGAPAARHPAAGVGPQGPSGQGPAPGPGAPGPGAGPPPGTGGTTGGGASGTGGTTGGTSGSTGGGASTGGGDAGSPSPTDGSSQSPTQSPTTQSASPTDGTSPSSGDGTGQANVGVLRLPMSRLTPGPTPSGEGR
ncbi:MAG: glycosyltransferase [Streptosporangiaceae bacterium]